MKKKMEVEISLDCPFKTCTLYTVHCTVYLYNIMFLLWPGHGGLVSKAISIINKNCSCDSGEELVQSEDSLLYITPLVSFQYGNTKDAIF